MAKIHVDRSAQSSRILRNVVAEDDTPHRTLPRSRFAHQQNLLLLLFARFGNWGYGRFILNAKVVHLLLHGGGERGGERGGGGDGGGGGGGGVGGGGGDGLASWDLEPKILLVVSRIRGPGARAP